MTPISLVVFALTTGLIGFIVLSIVKTLFVRIIGALLIIGVLAAGIIFLLVTHIL
jgi:hypothetical protein